MSHKTAAVILAAGIGSRAGGEIPKQYQHISGEPMLRKTICRFLQHSEISLVQVVVNPQHKNLYERALSGLSLAKPVEGGTTRQASVFSGLQALKSFAPDVVLIHDAARAFVSSSLISRVIKAVKDNKCGVVPALAVSDTLKQATEGVILKTINRSQLWLAQTPQGFLFDDIYKAHSISRNDNFTDDAAIAEANNIKVILIEGEMENKKITTTKDFRAHQNDVRTGFGFDVHAFEPGDFIVLCGVKISHNKKLIGHSDADAGLHAVTDAILGAIAAGDIGDHFPPSDNKWKNAASDIFLRHAVKLVHEKQGEILNVDLTLVCETPKISPYRDQMRKSLAKILEIDPDRVSVKATTTESLGFTGRNEGLAAQALATIKL